MNKDKTQFNGWKPKVVIVKSTEIAKDKNLNLSPSYWINKKTKMLEICMSKNGSIEHINNLPKGYGYYIKKI
tara:strand:+ start:204 stop:419 length:216 start_codon:yes stop_codon:yes gene_type:complete